MLKSTSKPKKVPWNPPGRNCKKKTSSEEDLNINKGHPVSKSSILKITRDSHIRAVHFSNLNQTYDIEISDDVSAAAMKPPYPKDNEEISFVYSNQLFDGNKDDLSIFLNDITKERKVLNLYYMSLGPVLQKLKRLVSNANIQDDTIQELLSKVEVELSKLFGSFEDLEFAINSFENALYESSNSESLIKVLEMKQDLLKKLLDCYYNILSILLMVFEELNSFDTKEFEKERDAFAKRYQAQEKKYLSLSAIVKDLERQLSILQGKYRAVEGYNNTLEETKTEFQNMIHHKDGQIRRLTSEMTKYSMKQDDEKWIELIEENKIKAETEKRTLKKALKAQKLYIQGKNQQLKELEEEKEKKVKMLLDLAAERDKLRVQMTVANNDLVQARYHIEEVKSQKLKLQNKLSELEIHVRNQLQEESEVFKKQLHEKGENELKLQNTVKHLEEELSATLKELEVLKSRHDSIKASLLQAQNEHSVDKVFNEVKSLTSLLQDTKDYFQNLRTPDIVAENDNASNGKNPDFENVVAMMQDMKRELLEIKRSDGAGNQYNTSSESDLLMQLEESKQKYKSLSEENTILKRQLKEKGNPSTFSHYAMDEKYSANNLESNLPTGDFQLQLALKNEEIMKYKHREMKLEYQLEEIKDKLQKKEMENVRLFSLEESLKKSEEELKSKKLELSLLEQRKHEESERLLRRTKDLQEALDESNAKNELLTRHIDMLKVSLHNVFGES